MTADFMTTRRHFLRQGLTLVGAGATVPAFIDRTALALERSDERILVIVQLAGGNDGLNTVVPFRRDLYYKNRPKLAITADKVLKINDELGLHPAAEGLKGLHDDGLLAVVQGVGYPNPNRSHFKSTDIWSTASPDGRQYTGWVGRYFDNTCAGADPCPPDRAIALTQESPLALAGKAFQPVAFTHPVALQWHGTKWKHMAEAFETLNRPSGTDPSAGEETAELAYLQRVAMDARLSAADIREASAGKPGVAYPQVPLAQSLRIVGRMIASNMQTRVYYVSHGGFDTHAGQENRHRQRLQQLADSLRAFIGDLKDQGNLDRVLVMTFSEFGRRVAENASGGTDHGTAAPMFLLGTGIKHGIHGRHPDLEDLDRGDLKFTTDFRSVYAAVLKDWLRADAATVLGKSFKAAELIHA